jgi:hypothetical protein
VFKKAIGTWRIFNQITWQKPDPVPNAVHTAFTH